MPKDEISLEPIFITWLIVEPNTPPPWSNNLFSNLVQHPWALQVVAGGTLPNGTAFALDATFLLPFLARFAFSRDMLNWETVEKLNQEKKDD